MRKFVAFRRRTLGWPRQTGDAHFRSGGHEAAPEPQARGSSGPPCFIAGFFLLTLLSAVGLQPAVAQVIPIRTVPVSQAHQFQIFPSRSLAMGGVSIAVADRLRDPFANPATATRLTTGVLFGSPGVYHVTEEGGGGRTLPLGALAKRGPWFGGLAVGLQQVDPSDRANSPPPSWACPACDVVGLDLSRNDRPRGNEYVFALLGRDLPGAVSLGASVRWSGLNAIDGVDLLYAGSDQIEQFGHAVDVRLGALKEWTGDRSLELVAVYNRFRMTHDVFYVDGTWDPDTRQTIQRLRLERNLDRTDTWGLHAEYEHPLPSEDWQIGWLGTVNYKSHPKIPNYEIMSIPRDPGHSTAFNVGAGIGWNRGAATFGIDLIYEPIWSHTWANAASAVETAAGGIVPEGGMTIENHFRFSNWVLRMGVGDELELTGPSTVAGFQVGLGMRRVQYQLEQYNHVELSDRELRESWVEWTPTWGLTLRRPSFEIGYRGYVKYGTGRPALERGGSCFDFCGPFLQAAGGIDILAAPSGPLNLESVRVLVHQVSFSLPLAWGGAQPRAAEAEANSGQH